MDSTGSKAGVEPGLSIDGKGGQLTVRQLVHGRHEVRHTSGGTRLEEAKGSGGHPESTTALDRIVKLTFKHFDAISDKL